MLAFQGNLHLLVSSDNIFFKLETQLEQQFTVVKSWLRNFKFSLINACYSSGNAFIMFQVGKSSRTWQQIPVLSMTTYDQMLEINLGLNQQRKKPSIPMNILLMIKSQ